MVFVEDVGGRLHENIRTMGTRMTSTHWVFEISLHVLSAWTWIYFRDWQHISSQQHEVSIAMFRGGQQRMRNAEMEGRVKMNLQLLPPPFAIELAASKNS